MISSAIIFLSESRHSRVGKHTVTFVVHVLGPVSMFLSSILVRYLCTSGWVSHTFCFCHNHFHVVFRYDLGKSNNNALVHLPVCWAS